MPYKKDEETGLRVTNGYTIERLWGIHRQICRLHVAGKDGKEIAAICKCSPQTVYNVLGSERGKAEVARLSGQAEERFEQIQERLTQIAPFALSLLEDVMMSENEEVSIPVKIGIAKDFLDRAGHKPVTKVETKDTTPVNMKFLKDVRKRAQELREAAKLQANAVDAEVVATTPMEIPQDTQQTK